MKTELVSRPICLSVLLRQNGSELEEERLNRRLIQEAVEPSNERFNQQNGEVIYETRR
ncbi:hypothetical protein [Bermanella sp. R86510]|uniref:hypothetical protein n=1 Tax=unclassified Bermanella TaxID=2627862 RepID=UPI0037C9D8F3